MHQQRTDRTSFSKRAQVSMEYLAVVGMSLALIMPMIVIFYEQSTSLEEDINAAQIEKIGLELIDAAEEAYYLGPPTQKLLNIHLPRGVQAITINQEELLFNYTTARGTSTLSFATRLPLNLSGTIRTYQGKHTIIVRAHQTGITINESTA